MPQNESSRHLNDMERNQSKESHSTISINKDGATRESVHNKSNLENNRLTYHFCSKLLSPFSIRFFQLGRVEAYQRLSILVAPPLFGDKIKLKGFLALFDSIPEVIARLIRRICKELGISENSVIVISGIPLRNTSSVAKNNSFLFFAFINSNWFGENQLDIASLLIIKGSQSGRIHIIKPFVYQII